MKLFLWGGLRLISKIMEKLKMIMVRLTNGTDCDDNLFVVEVGEETHLFCCQKGFWQSLEGFKQSDQDERTDIHNN